MEKIRRGRSKGPKGAEASLKRKAVLHYHHSTESLKVVAAQYGIGSTTLARWIEWYENDQARLLTLGSMEADSIEEKEKEKQTAISAEDSNLISSEASAIELKALQEELRLSKVKLACLETLIDVTEQDLGIDIRKKAGTRSSAE